MTGNSSGKPPASYTPILTCSARVRKCAVAGGEFTEGVADADDRPTIELVMRHALALDPAAVGKTVAVLAAEPLLAAQVLRALARLVVVVVAAAARRSWCSGFPGEEHRGCQAYYRNDDWLQQPSKPSEQPVSVDSTTPHPTALYRFSVSRACRRLLMDRLSCAVPASCTTDCTKPGRGGVGRGGATHPRRCRQRRQQGAGQPDRPVAGAAGDLGDGRGLRRRGCRRSQGPRRGGDPHAGCAERRRGRPGPGPDAQHRPPAARGRPLRAQRPVAAGQHAAGPQAVGRAAGHRRHGPHRPGHCPARASLRHDDRLHRPQRQGPICRTATCPALPRWPSRAISWWSSPPAAPAPTT